MKLLVMDGSKFISQDHFPIHVVALETKSLDTGTQDTGHEEHGDSSVRHGHVDPLE